MAVSVLLLAALFRFSKLATIPHGLYVDEAYNVVDEAAISWQHHPVFFFMNSGREALFFYWQNLFLLGLGVSTFSVRLASTTVAMLTVALQITTMRRFFGWRAGLLAGAILATIYCYVQDSRLGLRFNMVPGFVLLTLLTLHWAAGRSRPVAFAVPALCMGLAVHTYTAARVLPLIGVGFLVYLLCVRRVPVTKLVAGLAVAMVAYSVVAAPLALYIRAHQDALDHVRGIVGRDAGTGLAGILAAVGQNAIAYAASFGQVGDIQWLQNISRRPMFDPLMAMLFYSGLVMLVVTAVRRATALKPAARRDGAALCLLALVVLHLPGLLSRDAPYYLRVAGAWPVVALAPALTLDWLWRHGAWLRSSRLRAGVLLLPLALQTTGSAHDYFVTWARTPQVALRYGGGATDIAGYLRRNDPAGSVMILSNDGTVVQALAPAQWARAQAFSGDQFLPLPPNPARDTYYLLDLAPPYYTFDPSHPSYLFESRLSSVAERVLNATDPNAGIAVAHGYLLKAGKSLLGLLPSGPRADFDGRVGVTGASIAADTSAVGVYSVSLGLQAEGDLGGLIVSIKAVDGAGSVWGSADVRQEDTDRLVTGQRALAIEPLRLFAGTPPGRLSIDVGVWDNLAHRSVGARDQPGIALRLGEIAVSSVVPNSAGQPALPLERRTATLADTVQVQGIHVSTFTPGQNDPLQLDVFWNCVQPAPAGSRLDIELVDTHGRATEVVTPTSGLAAPGPDRCILGQGVLDRRVVRVGARWNPGTYAMRIALRDPTGTTRASASFGDVTVQELRRTTAAPAYHLSVRAAFNDGITLLGITATRPVGENVALGLVWQASGEPARNYTVFAHLLDPAGRLIAQHDGTPVNGTWPTSFWEVGQVVDDRHTLPLHGATVAAGAIVEIGLYDPGTGRRLSIINPGAAQAVGDALRLPLDTTTVTLPAADHA